MKKKKQNHISIDMSLIIVMELHSFVEGSRVARFPPGILPSSPSCFSAPLDHGSARVYRRQKLNWRQNSILWLPWGHHSRSGGTLWWFTLFWVTHDVTILTHPLETCLASWHHLTLKHPISLSPLSPEVARTSLFLSLSLSLFLSFYLALLSPFLHSLYPPPK